MIRAFLLKEEGMKQKERRDRELAVQRYVNGEGVAAIGKSLGYWGRWVYKWVARYHTLEAAAEWYAELSRCPHSNPRQVSSEIVEAVKLARLHLYNQGLFCGAQAITWELEDLGVESLPSLRTINRIRSEEHTSELQSHLNLVCRLLLEKKKNDISEETVSIVKL